MRKFFVYFGIIVSCQISVANANIIAQDAVGSGEILYILEEYVIPIPTFEVYGHYNPLTELFSDEYDSFDCRCDHLSLVSGYVIYDLSSVDFLVLGASLELDVNLSEDTDNVVINTIDMFSPSVFSTLPVGYNVLPLALGEALADDIASGGNLGSMNLTAGDGIYNVALNATAVDLINETGGLLAFGLSRPSYPYSFSSIDFNSEPRLILTVAEPGTLWLILVAVIIFMRQARSRVYA